jgi:spore maturation protein CgeB
MSRRLVVFGLSITSAWGNGHATTYRGLLRALAERGWEITFFEKDVEWYRSNQDLPSPDFCELRLYPEWDGVRAEAETAVRDADATLIGSYAGDPRLVDAVQAWRGSRGLLFYDIDTPITLTGLQNQATTSYLRADQVPLFDVYLSFTGGPALRELETVWGARRAEALYCAVDPRVHKPAPVDERFTCALGYMGTYSEDRQPKLARLLLEPAWALPGERFIIAGAQYPPMDLPPNVERYVHVYPRDHPAFYGSNLLTLNLTRDAMVRYGWSPSVRMFEAAACGACIASDDWPGLDTLLEPGQELLLVESGQQMQEEIERLRADPAARARIGEAARTRVLREHTYEQRAAQLESALAGAGVAPR